MEDEEMADCHDHSHPFLLPALNVNLFISDCDIIFLQCTYIVCFTLSELADKYF